MIAAHGVSQEVYQLLRLTFLRAKHIHRASRAVDRHKQIQLDGKAFAAFGGQRRVTSLPGGREK
jgi:hypothetical protein